MISKKHLQFVYKFWSKVYDNILDKLFYFDRSQVIKELKIRKQDKILEIGVGTGLNLPFYPKDCIIYGIDFSEEMLKEAHQKKSKANVILKLMDASNLKFKNDYFEKALATYVLRVAPDPNKIMQKVARVVKNNGYFVILDQFKEENTFLLKLFQPFKLILGWGKEYRINDLIKNTSWKIIKQKQIGKMVGTKIIVLKNKRF